MFLTGSDGSDDAALYNARVRPDDHFSHSSYLSHSSGGSPETGASRAPAGVGPGRDPAPTPQEIKEASELLKVVGDLTRTRILCELLEGERSVGGLQQALGMSQSAVSHQLRTLRDADLVKYRREWKTVYYSLSDDHVRDFLSVVVEHVRHE